MGLPRHVPTDCQLLEITCDCNRKIYIWRQDDNMITSVSDIQCCQELVSTLWKRLFELGWTLLPHPVSVDIRSSE